MKWIEIAKAKPKFDQDYLIVPKWDKGPAVLLARLEKSEVTLQGIVHTFDTVESGVQSATHIALITLPNEKEVSNG